MMECRELVDSIKMDTRYGMTQSEQLLTEFWLSAKFYGVLIGCQMWCSDKKVAVNCFFLSWFLFSDLFKIYFLVLLESQAYFEH